MQFEEQVNAKQARALCDHDELATRYLLTLAKRNPNRKMDEEEGLATEGHSGSIGTNAFTSYRPSNDSSSGSNSRGSGGSGGLISCFLLSCLFSLHSFRLISAQLESAVSPLD